MVLYAKDDFNSEIVYIFKREGTVSNPYVDITENITVNQDRVYLKEIPYKLNKVIVKLGNTTLNEVLQRESVLSNNDYYVDYSQGVVYFISAVNGTNYSFKYKGTGVVLFPASRIYMGITGNVVTTLAEAVNNIVLGGVTSVNGKTGIVNLTAQDFGTIFISSTDVVTSATANKILKLDNNSKLPASITGGADGNAGTASKLLTARTISFTGDVTGSGSFDGSANLSIATTQKNSGVTAGTYKSVTVDVKGYITAGTNPTTLAGYGITDATPSAHATAIANSTTLGHVKTGNGIVIDGTGLISIDVGDGIITTGTSPNQKVRADVDGTTIDLTGTSPNKKLSLKSGIVTAGTYKSVTVDTYGRVTGGTNPTTLSAYGITDAIPTSQKGVASGVAVLDSSGYVLDGSGARITGGTGGTGGNADTATKLLTARTIAFTGDAVGSGIFDGSVNVSISLTQKNSGVTAGTYKSVTVDAKGIVTAGSNPTTLSGYGITDAVLSTDVVTIATANKVLKLDANSKLPASIVGNADTATKLATSRTISFTGDSTGSGAFDGSGNISIALTQKNSGVTAGTYRSVTVDAKGSVTAGTNPTTLAGYGITDGETTTGAQTKADNTRKDGTKMMVVEVRTSDPASPVAGQIWFRSDL